MSRSGDRHLAVVGCKDRYAGRKGQIMKIMLCCNAGMSTSLLVQKMQKEVAARGEEVAIEARPMNEAMDHIDEDLEKAWLIRCTKNAIVDYFRKNSTHREVSMNDNNLKEMGNVLVEESILLHERQMYQKELTGRILREVQKANRLWYEVLIMICVDGLSYSEAARRLGITEPVLRARLHRARLFVRERFGDEYSAR